MFNEIKTRKENAQTAARTAGTYTTPNAGELLRDWGNLYEAGEKHAAHDAGSIAQYIKIVGGSVKSSHYYNGRFDFALKYSDALDVFGLAYTSSSDFAALWVCNVSAVLFDDQALKFQGVAINAEFESVFIFERMSEAGDELGTEYYTYIQLLKYIEDIQSRDRCIALDAFYDSAFEIATQAAAILAQYAGKPYGEKTREKIRLALSEFAKSCGGCSAYLNGNRDTLTIEKDAKGGRMSKNYYCEFLDSSNRILPGVVFVTEEKKPTKTATEAQEENNELRQKIKAVAGVLLPLLEQYNANNIILQKEDRDTQPHSLALWSLANYGCNR